jgi:hypothetical protein
VDRIGLVEAIERVRAELAEAVEKGKGADILFPVGSIQLEFNVVVSRDVEAKAGLQFWVVSLGGGVTEGEQVTHKVVLNLEPPVNADGVPLQVTRSSANKP